MQKGKDLILVTGATGKQGGAVARELLAAGHRVRVMTRKPEAEAAKALAARGAEVVHGDLDDPKALAQPLAGAWGAFAVQNTWEAGVEREEQQGKRFAELAKQAGVRHFVYTSVQSCDRRTGIPHFDNKWRVEETVRAQGFPSYVILRPVFFMDNFLSPQFRSTLDQGKLILALPPRTKLQMVAVEDVGKFGRLAFERHDKLNGQAISLAGDERTMPEAARIIGERLGRQIAFVQQPIGEVRQWSEDFAIMLEWFERVGYDVEIPKLEKHHGIRPLRLDEWARKAAW